MDKEYENSIALKKARIQELYHKLRTGWNVLWNRYGYYDYRIELGLLSLVIFVPVVLLFLLPMYIFVTLLKIQFVTLILPYLLFLGILLSIPLYLLTLNYAWVNGWYQ